MKEPGRILMVDRSRAELVFQESILRRRNTEIITAMAGSEAIERARAEKPVLIMFSFDLADMSAPEFCREIRSNDGTRATSLLLVAERDRPDQVDLSISAGCNDVVYRPLERNDLDRKVAKLTSIPARRPLRTLTKIDVSMEKNGRFLLGRSVDISANGVALEVDRVLPGSGPVRLHFFLPGDAKPMEIEAEVLRAEFVGTRAKYGLRFTSLTEEERKRIERFVEKMRIRESGS
jgi:DNA-binding response OmpR family regulator